jgi:hypothetical protein
MALTLKELLTGLVSKAYKLDESGVASLFNDDGETLKDDALQTLLNKDVERVTELTKGSKEKFDEGYKKAQKEVLSARETEIKEKYGITSDLKGLELIDAVIAATAPNAGELTDEQVKKSKPYLDLKESIPTEVQKATKAIADEYNNFKQGVEKTKLLGVVKNKALPLLESWNPILSQNPTVASNQKSIFERELESLQYRMDGERVILLDEDGKTDKLDAHGQRVDFEKHIRGIADKYYDFKQGVDKGSPENKNDGGNGDGKDKKYVVKDESDFKQQFVTAKTPQEKAGIYTAWEQTQKAASGQK